jgi:hypothetical protein
LISESQYGLVTVMRQGVPNNRRGCKRSHVRRCQRGKRVTCAKVRGCSLLDAVVIRKPIKIRPVAAYDTTSDLARAKLDQRLNSGTANAQASAQQSVEEILERFFDVAVKDDEGPTIRTIHIADAELTPTC